MIKNVLVNGDEDLDVGSSFNIVEPDKFIEDVENGRNEFELVDPGEYDFEMRNFMERFG